MLTAEHKTKIRQILENPAPIVIISHVNPDGDSVGSSLGFALFLKKLGISTSVIIPNDVPEFLQWLPGYDLINIYSKQKRTCLKILEEASTIFFLDFNDPGRMGELIEEVNSKNAYKILLDHHQNPTEFTDLIISESWRSSVGEMVYLFIKEMDMLHLLDKHISTCLYVAIMTDTGNFRYGASYSEIFSIAGALVEKGIDKNEIFSAVYDSYSVDRMKLLGYCMSEKMKVMEEYSAAYIGLGQDELSRFNFKVGDTEGFVNVPLSIKGIKVTALFTEKKDIVKVSLRSKGNFSVDKFAARYYQGGGHMNAAGGESNLSLDETIKQFRELIALHAHEIT